MNFSEISRGEMQSPQLWFLVCKITSVKRHLLGKIIPNFLIDHVCPWITPTLPPPDKC